MGEELDSDLRKVLAPTASLMAIQREAVVWLLDHQRAIYADEMGLGKTLACLALCGVRSLRMPAQQPKRPFRILIGVGRMNQADSWISQIKRHIAPDFFTIQKLENNTDRFVKADRLIVFVTLARMLICFKQAAELLPEDSVSVPKKVLAKLDKGAHLAVKELDKALADLDQMDEPEGGDTLLGAVLGAHGLQQQQKGKRRAGSSLDESEAQQPDPEAEKELSDLEKSVAKRLLAHSFSRLAGRKEAFDNRSYWTDQRVDPVSLLPNAPLVDPSPEAPVLYSTRWDGIIFDEAHDLRSSESSQWKAAMFLCQAGISLWTTGTPIQNCVGDLVSAMLWIREPTVSRELICKEALEPDASETLFGVAKPVAKAQEMRALKAMPQVTFRRSAEELKRTDPDKLAQDSRTAFLVNTEAHKGVIAKFFMSEKERELHDRELEKLRNVSQKMLLMRNKKNAPGPTREPGTVDGKKPTLKHTDLLAAFTRALQVCAGACVINHKEKEPDDEEGEGGAGDHEPIPDIPEFGIESTKMCMLIDTIKTKIPKGGKVIVFDSRVKVLELASRALTKNGMKSVIFAGSTPPKMRDALLETWKRADSNVNVLLAQTTMGGTTYTWTEAKHVIHLTPSMNPGKEDQADARVRRVGQDDDVYIYKLVVAGSLEELVLDMQERKRRMTGAVMTGAEANSRITLNPEDVLRGIDSLRVAPGARGSAHFRERDELAEKQAVERVRSKFKPPEWVTEHAYLSRSVVYLDPARAYSEGGLMPRGSLIFSVASAASHHALSMSHMGHRSQQRFSGGSLVPPTKKNRVQMQRDHKRSVIGVTPPAQEKQAPLAMRVAICPISLFVLLKEQVFEELEEWSRHYREQRLKEERFGHAPARPVISSTAANGAAVYPAMAALGKQTPMARTHNPDELGEAFAQMKRFIAARSRPGACPGYDLKQLNTPAEVAAGLRECFPPRLAVIHYCGENALMRGSDSKDNYHYRTLPHGSIEVPGHVAARITDPQEKSTSWFNLDVDVALSFAAGWLMDGCDIESRISKGDAPQPTGTADLYSPDNEQRRRVLHWAAREKFGSTPIPGDAHLINASEFSPAAVRYVLAPLVFEASEPNASASVRSMATAVMMLYALGRSNARLYMMAIGDPNKEGAGAIQGIAVAAVYNGRSVIVGAGAYTRSPTDHHIKEVLFHGMLEVLLKGPLAKRMYGIHHSLAVDKTAWKIAHRPIAKAPSYEGTRKNLDWGSYAVGYHNYERIQPAPQPATSAGV